MTILAGVRRLAALLILVGFALAMAGVGGVFAFIAGAMAARLAWSA